MVNFICYYLYKIIIMFEITDKHSKNGEPKKFIINDDILVFLSKLVLFFLSFAVFKVDKWIHKERAKYNRLITSRSGQPNQEMAPTQRVTLERWSFYKDHLLEGKNRTSSNVSIMVCNWYCTYFCLSVCLSSCQCVSLYIGSCINVYSYIKN